MCNFKILDKLLVCDRFFNGLRFSLWVFSISAIAKEDVSSTSLFTIAGMLLKADFLGSRKPSFSSNYFIESSSSDFLTIIGCIIPNSLIDSAIHLRRALKNYDGAGFYLV
jgi:hypothetical protein